MPTLEVPPNLRDYLRRLLRRKWHFFVPFVLALIAAGYVFYTKPKKYRATGVVRREDPVLLRALGQARYTEKVAEDAALAKARVTQRRELIRICCAETYKINLDRELKLEPNEFDSAWEAALNEGRWEDILEDARWRRLNADPEWANIIPAMRGGISIRVQQGRGGGVQLITIQYDDRNPQLAQKVCSALAQTYIAGGETGVKDRLEAAAETLRKQLEELDQQRLRPTRQALEEFEETWLGKLPRDAAGVDAELKDRTAAVENASALVVAAKKAVDALEQELQRTPQNMVIRREHGRNPRVEQIETELREYQSELRRLKMRFTEEHPRIKELESLIEALDRERTSLPPDVEEGWEEGPNPRWQWFNQQLDERRRLLAELENRLEARQGELKDLEARKMNILERHRRFIALKEEHARLAEERQRLAAQIEANEQELRTHRDKEGIRFEVLDYPVTPTSATAPDPVFFLIVGLLAGAAAGVGSVALAEHTDHSLRTVSDTAEVLKPVPVVGTIGLIRTRRQRHVRTLLRVGRWVLLVAVVVGAGGATWRLWQHPWYRKQMRAFWKDPRATIHRWTGDRTKVPPIIASLEAAQDTDSRTLTLTVPARDVSDVDGLVEQVAFYRDTNGNGRFDPAADQLLATDPSIADGWSWTGSTAGWPPGEFVCFARARDNDGRWSQEVRVSGTLSPTE